MLFVQSVSRSIAFYAKLGFNVGNSFTPAADSESSWAWLHSGGANLMITRASHPVDATQQAVIFCLYCKDVQSFWTALQQAGVKVGDIEYPSYHPRGLFRLADPDGFDISVSQRSSFFTATPPN